MARSESERERRQRRQRMLAREQGTLPGSVPGTTGNIGLQMPQKVRRHPAAAPPAPASNLKSISPLIRRRQRRRRALLGAAVVIAAAVVAWLTGALSTSIALLGDVADSVTLYLDRSGGGWPVNTGINTPLQIEALAGGFVEMDAEDVVVYSAYGSKVRSIQPGYARPTLAVGNTRFVVYNRAGNELRVESRTRTLYTSAFEEPILLCAMSNNGTLAVVTESSRYAAELTVYDPAFRELLTWQMTQTEGTPIAVRFAPDNRRFAVGTLAARNGQLSAAVCLMDLNGAGSDTVYTATTGSMLLRLQWLSSSRLLAVFDNYIAILDAASMTETARYDIGGGTLQSVSVGGRQTALLVNVRGGNTLVTLSESLVPLAEIPAGQATGITAAETGVYLLGADRVQFYGFDGVQKWEKLFDTSPLAVLAADKTLVFTSTNAEVLGEP